MGQEEDTGANRSPDSADPPEAVPSAARPDGPPGSRPGGPWFAAFITGGAYGALGMLGITLGVLGSFLHAGMIGPVPVNAVLLILINFGTFWLAGRVMNSPFGVLVPAAGWLFMVVAMSAKRPEGDLVIASTLPGHVFMFGGLAVAVIAVIVAFARSAGSWLLRGADPDSRVG